MRINQASLDLQNQFGVADDVNGLERFLTATRRQNFLIPPRRHRAFPLAEFTSPGARQPAGLAYPLGWDGSLSPGNGRPALARRFPLRNEEDSQ